MHNKYYNQYNNQQVLCILTCHRYTFLGKNNSGIILLQEHFACHSLDVQQVLWAYGYPSYSHWIRIVTSASVMLHDKNVRSNSFKTMYLRQPWHVIFKSKSLKYLKHTRAKQLNPFSGMWMKSTMARSNERTSVMRDVARSNWTGPHFIL